MAYPEAELARHFVDGNHCSRPTLPPQPRNFLDIYYETDHLIERIGHWTPKNDVESPGEITPNSNIKIAAILEDRLYQGLRYEARLMLLTPRNWKSTLLYGKPDMLLMESIWTTATGHWHMGQCPPARDRNELLGIVALAKKQSIPTVFWITKGHAYHEHYKDFARYFDHVFCASPEEAERLRQEGVKAEMLPPCAQPALYRRKSENFDATTQTIPILFDGWADLDRMADDLAILKKLKPFGLRIMESRYQVFSSRKKILPEFKDIIMGCVTAAGRRAALRDAKVYITFEKTLSSTTTQQWMSLEAAAAGLPVIHQGRLPETDPRREVVAELPDQKGILDLLIEYNTKNDLRRRQAEKGFLIFANKHTFENRIKLLFDCVGYENV